jgi:hypothetical protein
MIEADEYSQNRRHAAKQKLRRKQSRDAKPGRGFEQ